MAKQKMISEMANDGDHRGRATRRVLLIHGDQDSARTFARAMQSLRLESAWAQSGQDGLLAVRSSRFDLHFVDLDLPDVSGLAVIRHLRAQDHRARFIIVSGAVTASVARDALHLGARGVLAKPFNDGDVMAAVQMGLDPESADDPRASSWTPLPPAIVTRGRVMARRTAPRSTAERWAALIRETIHADGDPRTITLWARSIGLSRSTLCECCRLLHISPHDARDFARLMRVVCRSGRKWEPEMLLDLADARTLKKLLVRGGLPEARAVAPSPADFLDGQQWIPRANPGLIALRALFASHDVAADPVAVGE